MSGAGTQGVVLRAHAKVNLGLAVLARRGDGFHEVETLMVRLALHDDVVVRRVAEDGVALRTAGLAVPSGGDNLAVRAARAYLERAGVGGGASIALTKRIPVAAGLGGGSSDAGAVLRGLHALVGADVDLAVLAAELGSDVPFFAADLGAALARGRGERLLPAPEGLPRLHLVLANPGVPIAAADAYRRLLSFTPRLRPERLVEALARGDEAGLVNGLQPGVVAAYPAVREALAALRAAGLRNVLLSGSGATCFGLAADAEAAREAAGAVGAAHPDWTVVTTHTL